MDTRQTNIREGATIREGAGLEESRLNTEFIELLRKAAWPLMLCIILVAGSYAAYNRFKIRTELKTDEAYLALDAAAESRSPASLLRVADEHPRGAVPVLARLTAADIHLEASRTGVPVGTQLDAAGAMPADVQPLSAEQKADELKTAAGLYQQVFDAVQNDPARLELGLVALHGLAACAEGRGELDAAKGFYQQVIDRATAAKLPEWAKRAEALKGSVDQFKDPARLYAQAELPSAAASMQPFTSGMQDIKVRTSTGEEMRIGEDGSLQRIELPPTDPAAAPGATPPAPAPADPNAPAAPATPPAAPAETPAATPAPATPAPANPPAAEPGKPG